MTRHVFTSIVIAGVLMSGCDARAGAFVSGTTLPTADQVRALGADGHSTRQMVEAVRDGDAETARRLLDADPALARIGDGRDLDMLTLAIARDDRPMVRLLLDKGAPPDGPNGEVPLSLALRARAPWHAQALLQAGAKPDPIRADGFWPLDEAISLNSLGAVRLLLDHGADVNRADRTGGTPLESAVAMQNYRIAELLLERGADPWAVGVNGDTIAAAATAPVRPDEPEEAQARDRVLARLQAAGWKLPPPSAQAVRAEVLAGRWPPAHAQGGRPPSPEIVDRMRRLWPD
ncbi:ankyrin repeat domain-containing protein [Brevundimonas sp.]|uniref:ankyrin repeat domain-containing protein n=1 Tax=Brevundimonas sp. TaxID=1871086 RepID=UPI003D0C0A79